MDPRTHLNYHRKLLALSLLGLNQLPAGLKGKLNTLSWCSRCKRTVERQFTYNYICNTNWKVPKILQRTNVRRFWLQNHVDNLCKILVENALHVPMNNFNYLLPIKFTFLFRKQPQQTLPINAPLPVSTCAELKQTTMRTLALGHNQQLLISGYWFKSVPRQTTLVVPEIFISNSKATNRTENLKQNSSFWHQVKRNKLVHLLKFPQS